MDTAVKKNRLSAIFDNIRKDPSAITLVLANGVSIIVALVQGWSLFETMAVYLCQNIIIGLFSVLRILTVDIDPGGKVDGTGYFKYVRYLLAGFFAVHYGMFQFVYYIFLQKAFREINKGYLLGLVAVFFSNHAYSFFYNSRKKINFAEFGKLMLAPYRRIMPMHITIIFGTFFMLLMENVFHTVKGQAIALLLFLSLKTVADVQMHIDEHATDPDT